MIVVGTSSPDLGVGMMAMNNTAEISDDGSVLHNLLGVTLAAAIGNISCNNCRCNVTVHVGMTDSL